MSFQKPEKDFGEGPVRGPLHLLRQPQFNVVAMAGNVAVAVAKIFNDLKRVNSL